MSGEVHGPGRGDGLDDDTDVGSQRAVSTLPVAMEAIFDYLDAAVIMLDAEGRLVVWNRKCEELVGNSKADAARVLDERGVLGPAWYHDERRSMVLAEKVVDAPETADQEYGIRRVPDADYTLYADTSSFVDKNGDERFIEFSAAPIYDDGEFVGVIELVLTDLEAKLEKDQLRGLVSEMQQAMGAVEDGDLGVRVRPDGTDHIEEELLAVVDSFNGMVGTLEEVAMSIHEQAESLREATERVSEGTDQIASAAADQERTLQDVEAEISNLSATVEEIASTASEVQEQSTEADRFAEEVHESASRAQSRMDEVMTAAGRMQESMEQLADQLAEVSQLLTVIDDIAEQTNMLALNASIEAARAGEAGEGFAVVADEVKSLAEESQQRASEIETTITRLENDAGDTVAGLEETTEELHEGMEMVTDVAADIEKTADAISAVNTGIGQVAEATDDQAETTEQITSIVDDVVDQARSVTRELDDIVDANQQQVEKADRMVEAVHELTGNGRRG